MLALISFNAVGQVLPPGSYYNWSNFTGTVYRDAYTNIVSANAFGADRTGVTNNAQTNIMAAWNSSPSNSIITLEAGTYLMGNELSLARTRLKGWRTLRGKGTNVVLLVVGNSTGYAMKVGADGLDPLYGNLFPTNPIVQGMTNFIVPTLDSDLFAGWTITPGAILNVAARNPVNTNGGGLQVMGGDFDMRQVAIVHSVSGNTITITHPLAFSAPYVVLDWIGDPARDVGIENIMILTTNSILSASGYGIEATVLYNSYFSNVTVKGEMRFYIAPRFVTHLGFERLSIEGAENQGNGHAGLLTADMSNCRLENSIFRNVFPPIEYNGGTIANVFGYNYVPSPVANAIGAQNHGPHPMYNLWEGNVYPTHHQDGYFGSVSHETFFRNDFDGEEALTEGGVAWGSFFLNRWSTSNNFIANILGTNAATLRFSYEPGDATQGIFRFGYPQLQQNTIGAPWMASLGSSNSPPIPWNFPGHEHDYWGTNCRNGRYAFTNNQFNTNILWGDFLAYVPVSGATQPNIVMQDGGNTNLYWNRWGDPVFGLFRGGSAYPTAVTASNMTLNRAVSVTNGARLYVAMQNSYMQRQTSNYYTHTFYRNLLYTNGIGQAGTLAPTGAESLLTSLYLNSKPAWMGTNRFPAKDVEAATSRTFIPAESRFFYGEAEADPSTNAPRTVRGLKVVVGRLVR